MSNLMLFYLVLLLVYYVVEEFKKSPQKSEGICNSSLVSNSPRYCFLQSQLSL